VRAAVRIRMDAKYRLSLTPGNDGRFECAGRRFDMRFSYPCCTPDASISAARSTSSGFDFRSSFGILFLR